MVIGIVVGGLFYANFDIKLAYLTIFTNSTDGGLLTNLSDSGNVGILIFLVILGIMVALMNKAGGSAAYGRWATKAIKSRRGALLSTFLLGVLVFVDDYFNCLTVGSVMRPVTDTHKVSRAKLAYIIDATAAPICIIAPISSWAAAVAGVVEGMNGLELFIKAIPYNFYALLSIVAMLTLTITNTDFGPMLEHERNAQLNDDLYTTAERPYADANAESEVVGNGKVIDLVLPVIVLIVCCIIGMIYTGGFFDGETFIDAFANCDSPTGLLLGSAAALLITFVMYIPRRVLTFRQFMDCLPEGFKAIVRYHRSFGGRRIRSRYSGKQHRRIADADPCDRILYCGIPCLRNRYLLGYIWYPAAYCCTYYARRQRNADHHSGGNTCRRRLRRPLLSYLRYNDHGFHRRSVRPHQPRIHTAALCSGGSGCFRCELCIGGIDPELGHQPADRYHFHGCGDSGDS